MNIEIPIRTILILRQLFYFKIMKLNFQKIIILSKIYSHIFESKINNFKFNNINNKCLKKMEIVKYLFVTSQKE